MTSPRGWLAGAAFFFVAASAARAEATAPPPVEAFFSKTAVSDVSISPTGRHVAFTVVSKEGLRQLAVMDTDKPAPKVIASFNGADVVNVHWASDKRLVFSASDADHEIGRMGAPGLYAVDADGSEFRQLARVDRRIVEQRSMRQMLDASTRFHSTTWGADSDDVFITQEHWKTTGEFDSESLLLLDTRSGIAKPFRRPGDTVSWAVDPANIPRVALTHEAAFRGAVQYLDPASGDWVKVGEYDRATSEGDAFWPVGFASDGTLYVGRRERADTSALYTFDVKTKKLSEQPVLSVRGFDIEASLVVTSKGLLGVRYVSDAEATYWVDPDMKALQARIDKVLPGAVNRVQVPYRAEVPFYVVASYSDRDPGAYFIYDAAHDKLMRFGRSHPGLDPVRMGTREFVRFKARDGLEIPAWVTRPTGAGKGKAPMVVLVHGGPWLRGSNWGWSAEAQFLASRGYVVLEPEFRGSVGYGFRLFKAGWKQWGLAMQDDIADGTRWAIAQGIADPSRICIAGASYGGYAALMGLAKDPDLYRCGVDFAGVTDLNLMYTASWSDASTEYRDFGMPKLIGDPEKDAAQLKATSPVAIASRIHQPLLMAHGGFDRRVPPQHGLEFRDAVQKTNANVEWVLYSEEGHGLFQTKDRVDFWTRVEKFLARNIGTP